MTRLPKLAAVLALLTLPALAPADPLDLKQLPADTRWLVHLDTDAIRQSQLFQAALARADRDSNGDASRKLAAMSTLLGTRLEDVHSITVIGKGTVVKIGTAGVDGVVVVHARVDRERLTALAKLNPDYKAIPYAGGEISSWHDDKSNKTMFGSIVGDSTLILGGTQDQVQQQLDTLSGKSKPFAAESGAVAAVSTKGAGALFFIAGENLSDLAKAQGASPVLAQLDSAWVAIAESPTDLTLRAAVNAKTPEAATQLRAMADGFKALAVLAGGSGSPDQRFLADAVSRATLSTSNSTLTLEWPLPLATVKSILAAPKPATSPAPETKE